MKISTALKFVEKMERLTPHSATFTKQTSLWPTQDNVDHTTAVGKCVAGTVSLTSPLVTPERAVFESITLESALQKSKQLYIILCTYKIKCMCMSVF